MAVVSSGRSANNLNAMRLIAAFLVVVSHSFALAYGAERYEPLFSFSHGQATLGHVAVLIFFAISGYLITKSFCDSKTHLRFVISRALRILPGLAFVLAVTIIVIGPIFSNDSATNYALSPKTWNYFAGNLSLLQFKDHLPGMFSENPYPFAVNGSLWTLHYEAWCYAAVLALGISGLLRWPMVFLLMLIGCAAEHMKRFGFFPELIVPFAAGAIIYLADIPRSREAAWVCLALCVLSLRFGGFSVIAGVFGSYAVLVFGLESWRFLPDPARKIGDLSYGVYIWAFPIQQIIVMLSGGHVSWYALILYSTPPLILVSWISWHLVELPAQRLKPKRDAAVEMPQLARLET